MSSKLAFTLLALASLAAPRARAADCYDVETVPASTTNAGSASCSATIDWIIFGIPTPWGTVGVKIHHTTVTTTCFASILFVPEHHKRIPGTHRVTDVLADGWIKTNTGCHASGSAAVCDYSQSSQSVEDWVIIGDCPPTLPPPPDPKIDPKADPQT